MNFSSGLDGQLEAVSHGDRRRVLFELRQTVRSVDIAADVATAGRC